MRERTIAVVTALTPSATTLSEYGLHLLTALGRKPGVRVIALVEDGPLDYPVIPGVEIRRAWRFGSLRNPWRIARAVRSSGADVALFNAHFSSFGASRLASALGLVSPALTRLLGVPAMTLLHNIVETVDLTAAGFGVPRGLEPFLRLAGTLLTWSVLRSNVVLTTMPRYVEILREKFHAENVALAPHGALEVSAAPCEPPKRPVVSAFGKFGTYKRVEGLIDAVRRVEGRDVDLLIAGTDSPNAPGYLAAVEARMGGPDVRFTGYVREEDVEGVFRGATMTVFPYTATTGSSGVLHQAAAYGCAPVLPRVGDLEDLIQEEGFTGVFFEPGDDEDLARAIASLLDDEEERRRIVLHNHRAVSALTLEDVADWYLVHAAVALGESGTALLAQSRAERDARPASSGSFPVSDQDPASGAASRSE